MKLDYLNFLENILHKNKYNFFLVLGIAGVILIAVGNGMPGSAVKENKSDISNNEYRIQLENEITDLLEQMQGVGDVKVMITLQSGAESIYAQQKKISENNQKNSGEKNTQENTQSTYENEIVIVSDQNVNQPLIEKTVLPEIQGVAVVCSGADDIAIISAVTNTVSVVLNLPTNRIYVTKMK